MLQTFGSDVVEKYSKRGLVPHMSALCFFFWNTHKLLVGLSERVYCHRDIYKDQMPSKRRVLMASLKLCRWNHSSTFLLLVLVNCSLMLVKGLTTECPVSDNELEGVCLVLCGEAHQCAFKEDASFVVICPHCLRNTPHYSAVSCFTAVVLRSQGRKIIWCYL